jgi:hypothetical protein
MIKNELIFFGHFVTCNFILKQNFDLFLAVKSAVYYKATRFPAGHSRFQPNRTSRKSKFCTMDLHVSSVRRYCSEQ